MDIFMSYKMIYKPSRKHFEMECLDQKSVFFRKERPLTKLDERQLGIGDSNPFSVSQSFEVNIRVKRGCLGEKDSIS